MKIVATTSLPAVDCPNGNRWNAARSCQLCRIPKYTEEKMKDIGHQYIEFKSSVNKIVTTDKNTVRLMTESSIFNLKLTLVVCDVKTIVKKR